MTADVEARERLARLEGQFEGHRDLLLRANDRLDLIVEKIDDLPSTFLTKQETILHLEKADLVHRQMQSEIDLLKTSKLGWVARTRTTISEMPKVNRVLLLLACIGLMTVAAGVAAEVASGNTVGLVQKVLRFFGVF